jgi:hypothetical protein
VKDERRRAARVGALAAGLGLFAPALALAQQPPAPAPLVCGSKTGERQVCPVQNLVSVEIGKDFMLSQKYIEKAAKELLELQWKKVTTAKLPEATELLATSPRIG